MTHTQPSGWIILDKPAGMSSRAAGGRIARMFGTKKFGHLGTLDPDASGVLPIALSHATKMIPFLETRGARPKESSMVNGQWSNNDKEYLFQIKWGIRTGTDDLAGKIIDQNDLRPTIDQITGVLGHLTGEIMQTPPAYSAIHINGARSYDLARRGVVVDMPKRRVFIESLEIIDRHSVGLPAHCPRNLGRGIRGAGNIDDLVFRVRCSTGTYVRSIVRDIARLINNLIPRSTFHIPHFICTTSMIRRTRNYGFDIKNAVTLDFLENLYHNTPDLSQDLLWPIDFGLGDILVSKIDGGAVDLFQNGGRIPINDNNVGLRRVYTTDSQFLGIAELRGGVLHPKRILKD